MARASDGAVFAEWGERAYGYWLDRESCQKSIDGARRGHVCIKDQSSYNMDVNSIYKISTREPRGDNRYLSFKSCLAALEEMP